MLDEYLQEYMTRKYRTDDRPSPLANLIREKVAIVGIGQTEFSKDSGRSELQLACEAIKAAAEDAGLKVEDIDGLSKFTIDMVDETSLVNCLGIRNLAFFGEHHWGGGASCPTVFHAATAVATGMANYVVCYRALNERSGRRYGYASNVVPAGMSVTPNTQSGYIQPFGMVSPIAQVAVFARRYMIEFGATSEHLGWASVVCREHAQRNPNAMMYGRPMTIKDHQESPFMAAPLRKLDCCLDSDGAVSLLVTTVERAKDLKQRPAIVMAAALGIATEGEMMTSVYRPRYSGFPDIWYAAEEMYRISGIKPQDIDVAQLYDAFSPLIPLQLEEFGFCGVGEGAAFCEGGHRIRLGGQIPCNTSGGHLSEAYMHGMNLIAEAVRQVRGTSYNQVKDVELSLVTAGQGIPTGTLLLRR